MTYDYGEVGRQYHLSERGRMLRWLVTSGLDGMGFYHQTVEQFIDAEERRETELIESTDPGRIDWAEAYPIHWQEYVGRNLRTSYIGALIAFAEWHVHLVCIEVSSTTLDHVWTNKAYGSNLAHAVVFLQRIGHSAGSVPAWNVVNDVVQIRHVLVHHGGFIEGHKRQAELAEIVRRSPGLDVRGGSIDVSPGYCAHAHQHVAALFTQMFDEHEAFCARHENKV